MHSPCLRKSCFIYLKKKTAPPGDLGRSWNNFKDLGSKGKILSGSWGIFLQGFGAICIFFRDQGSTDPAREMGAQYCSTIQRSSGFASRSEYGHRHFGPAELLDPYTFLFKIRATTWDFQQYGMCDQQSLRSAFAYTQSDQSLC